jgi:hypothetical protein
LADPQRFRQAGAGRVALNEDQLREHLNTYLRDPSLDAEKRSKFIAEEITFTDGSAGKRTADYIFSLL